MLVFYKRWVNDRDRVRIRIRVTVIIIIIIIITRHLYSALQRTQRLKQIQQEQIQQKQSGRKQVRFKGTPEGRHRHRFPQIRRELIPKFWSSS